MRGVVLLALSLIVVAALSGCVSSGGKEDASTDSTTSASGSSTSRTSSPGNVTAAANHAPVTNLTLAANATAGVNATFLINATDADGDTLTWTLAFGDNASANGTVAFTNGTYQAANVTHAYASAGAVNVTLVVSDGKANATTSLKVNITSAAPSTVVVLQDDADGDANLDMTEVKDITITVTPESLTLVANVGDVPTGLGSTPAFSPYGFRLTINGGEYSCYNYVGVDTFSSPDGGYIGGCTWDEGADTVTMAIAIEALTAVDLVAPFDVSFTSYQGALTNGVDDDAVPDSGTVRVG